MSMFNASTSNETSRRTLFHILTQASTPYIILVSVIGLAGNFLTILMLAKRTLSKNFNNCTLIALALTDLVFNLTLVCRCVIDHIPSNGDTVCRILSFLSHLAELLSACFTAQFTAQRFIAVRFPLSVFIAKRIHLIHYAIVSIFIVLGCVYCLAFVRSNSYEGCHEESFLNWFISDAILSFLLPFTIIAILNLLIIFHLKKGFQNNQPFRFRPRHQSESVPLNTRMTSSMSQEMTTHSQCRAKIYKHTSMPSIRTSIVHSLTNGDGRLCNGRVRSIDLLDHSSSLRSKSQSYRVTRMLILVSTCFLLLNAPAHISSIGLKFYTIRSSLAIESSSPYPSSSTLPTHLDLTRVQKSNASSIKRVKFFYLMLVVTQHISYASYSINFFLYSFCGMKFRRELTRCIFKQQRHISSSRSMTVQNGT